MKRIFLIILLLQALPINPLAARVKFGILASAETLGNYRFGVETYIPVGGRWDFKPGLFWEYRDNTSSSGMGGDDTYEYYDCRDKVNYLIVPLMMRKRMSKLSREKFVAYFHLGTYIGCGLWGTSECHYMLRDKDPNYWLEWPYHYGHETPADGEEPYITKDELSSHDAFGPEGGYTSRFDFGTEVGFSFLIMKHYQLGLYIQVGVANVYRERGRVCCSTATAAWHRGAGLSLGYLF